MDEKNKNGIKPADDVVVDKGKFSWSDLWKLEDYWAIWLGAILLIIGLLIFIPRPPADMHERINTANATLQAEAEKALFQTIAWHEANDAKKKISAKNEGYAKNLSAFLARPKGWVSNPVDAFYMSEEKAAAKREVAAEKFATTQEVTSTTLANAQEAEAAAAAVGFNNKDLNQQAEKEIAAWRSALAAESKAKKAAEAKPYNLIGNLIVLGVAWYWCAKVECAEGQRVSYKEIWFRFPKFVLGFLGASVVFSLIYQSMGTDVANVMIDQGVVSVWTKTLQGWFFCLAFVSIGLATNFRELGKYLKGGKPLILYVCGQSFNLFLTLVVAYIMFFLVFPEITAKIVGQ